ncbi:MAG: permease, partial [Ruminococcus sp.]|nr:permease [Ruminococcus sp.]
QYEDVVTVGHGIAYLFGVIGVVLFVQLIPKLTKANMEEERKIIKISATDPVKKEPKQRRFLEMDHFGLMPFFLAALIGIIVGAIKIPLSSKGFSGTTFSLTTTGGTLIVSLIFGHLGHVGKMSLKVERNVLEVFREYGLMLFLIGAGVAGGAKFIEYFQPIYFVYGVLMTLIPMIIGFLFAKYVLKLSLLNNLGSITGGMTSTPALGTLISVAGTNDVASAYAATYPIALIAVVVASQLICTLLG